MAGRAKSAAAADTPAQPIDPELELFERGIQAIQQAESERTFGRPSVVTPERVRQLFVDVELGVPLERACELAGISYRTYRRWIEAGQQDETESTPAYYFRQAMRLAEGRCQRRRLTRLDRAGHDPRFWTADMTTLQRRFPEEWGEKSRDASAHRSVSLQIMIGIAPPGTPQNPLVTVHQTDVATALNSPLNADSPQQCALLNSPGTGE